MIRTVQSVVNVMVRSCEYMCESNSRGTQSVDFMEDLCGVNEQLQSSKRGKPASPPIICRRPRIKIWVSGTCRGTSER